MRASGGICAAAKAGCAFAKHGAASQSVCESCRMTVVSQPWPGTNLPLPPCAPVPLVLSLHCVHSIVATSCCSSCALQPPCTISSLQCLQQPDLLFVHWGTCGWLFPVFYVHGLCTGGPAGWLFPVFYVHGLCVSVLLGYPATALLSPCMQGAFWAKSLAGE